MRFTHGAGDKDISMTDIPNEVKAQLLAQELATYENTRYLLSLRHRVNKKINAPAETLKAIEDELVKIEAALDELTAIQKELASMQTRILAPVIHDNGK
jgi:DNA repair exonuclease SbcCD ATPase subunit